MSLEQPPELDDAGTTINDLVRADALDALPPTVFGHAVRRAAANRDVRDRFVLWNRVVQ